MCQRRVYFPSPETGLLPKPRGLSPSRRQTTGLCRHPLQPSPTAAPRGEGSQRGYCRLIISRIRGRKEASDLQRQPCHHQDTSADDLHGLVSTWHPLSRPRPPGSVALQGLPPRAHEAAGGRPEESPCSPLAALWEGGSGWEERQDGVTGGQGGLCHGKEQLSF